MTAQLNSHHVSRSERTEAVAGKLRGDAIRSALLSALTPLVSRLALMCPVRKTQMCLSPLQGEQVNGPLI